MKEPYSFRFRCHDLTRNTQRTHTRNGFTAEILHRTGEPSGALRIWLSKGDTKIELLPSKGFSVGEAFVQGRPVFWEPPFGLPDPAGLRLLSGEIAIHGVPAEGFSYLQTFMGGIELYGLRNWGMPRRDRDTGELHPLHGETSNIPVGEVQGAFFADRAELSAEFTYRQFSSEGSEVWYDRGKPLFRLVRTIVLPEAADGFQVIDEIRNISELSLVPDWGYHITFRPVAGSRLLVPSGRVMARPGGDLPEDIETWRPAAMEKTRSETGVIHQGLMGDSTGGTESCRVLLRYPDGWSMVLSFPPSPYFQTWFCNGGAFSKEFTMAGTGEPLLKRNWDGQGVEFGSSPLDHDGNRDPSVSYRALLEPGESLVNRIGIRLPGRSEGDRLEREIEAYNRNNRKRD